MDLRNLDFYNTTLIGADLSGADLSGTKLNGVMAFAMQGDCPSAMPDGYRCVTQAGGTQAIVGHGVWLTGYTTGTGDWVDADLPGQFGRHRSGRVLVLG